MRRPVAVLLLFLLAVAALGCGRPQARVQPLPRGPLDKSRYIRAFELSAVGLAQRYGLTEPGAGAPPAEQADHVADLQRVLRAWADRLASLQPPAEARRAHVRFVAGVRGFAVDLERARAALRRGDQRGADRLLSTGRVVSARTRADLVASRRAFRGLNYRIDKLDEAPVRTP